MVVKNSGKQAKWISVCELPDGGEQGQISTDQNLCDNIMQSKGNVPILLQISAASSSRVPSTALSPTSVEVYDLCTPCFVCDNGNGGFAARKELRKKTSGHRVLPSGTWAKERRANSKI